MKKYYGEFLGKKIVLSESDWSQLRKRYDVGLAVKEFTDEYKIRVSCPLCHDYLVMGCLGCTFNKFRNNGTTDEGCTNSLEVLLGTDKFPFEIDVAYVSWSNHYNKKAMIALGKVYRELGKMELRG